MKKLGIFFFLFVFSCNSFEKKISDQTNISKNEMINIMVDLAMSDAMVETEMLETNKLIYQKKLTFYKTIFESHGYSEEEFTIAYDVYNQDLTLMSEMYDSVMVIISKKEIELN